MKKKYKEILKACLYFYGGYLLASTSMLFLRTSAVSQREFKVEHIVVDLRRPGSLGAILLPCGVLPELLLNRTVELHASNGSTDQWGEIYDVPDDASLETLMCRSDGSTITVYRPGASEEILFVFPRK